MSHSGSFAVSQLFTYCKLCFCLPAGAAGYDPADVLAALTLPPEGYGVANRMVYNSDSSDDEDSDDDAVNRDERQGE